ncbi:unnamed protein product [Ectocarpus sp. 8 AP-2014]
MRPHVPSVRTYCRWRAPRFTFQDPLYPYVCSECKAGFNAAKALDFHQREVHKSAAAKGSELGGAGPPTPMSEWSLSDARQWLTSVVAALQQPAEYVQSICASLEKSLAAQDKGQRVGAKRKATRTAGQQLMLISLSLLTELCGGNAAAAEKLHHETGRKRSERSRKDKSRVASYNAAQRQNQNVRKPWVAHVNAELNTASKAAAATTPASAASAAVAAAATTTATTATSMTTTAAVVSEAGVAAAPAASPAVPGATVVGGSTMVVATTDASAAVPPTTLGVVGPAAAAAGVVG